MEVDRAILYNTRSPILAIRLLLLVVYPVCVHSRRVVGRCARGCDMDQILSLLAAFGLGSVVTALTQSALTNRTKRFDRTFAAKQAAYVGLLEARHRHRSAVGGTGEEVRSVAYWRARCDLVGSAAVREAISQMVEPNDDSEGLLRADDHLRGAMRRDLKIED